MRVLHMYVSKLVQEHQGFLEYTAKHVETTDEERESARARNTRIIEGVPVHKELAAMCDEVSKIARGIRFAIERNGKVQWVNGVPARCEIWAYYPEDEYAVMRLGFADYSVRDGSKNKYAIYSRNIRNEKFNEDREQYHMVMADTLARAVANVKKYMRRYAVHEVADMSLSGFQRKLSTVSWEATNEYDEARRGVIDHSSFKSELRALITRGYQFNDPTFGVAVQGMMAKMDELRDKQHTQHHGYYVQVREYMGEQVFDVIAVFDVKKATRAMVGSHRTYKSSELEAVDENLPSRLATLSMLEDGAFVEGLGHKVSPTSYWVLK